MTVIFQTFSNVFSWMKMFKFRLIFDWSLFQSPINSIPALVQMMAWCRPGDKPLSEAMVVSLLRHSVICPLAPGRCGSNFRLVIPKVISTTRCLEHFLWNCPQSNATRHHWWIFNFSLGNGLAPLCYNKSNCTKLLTVISTATVKQ